MDTSDALTSQLIRLALAPGSNAEVPAARRLLTGATPRAWHGCMMQLSEHRIEALAHYGLSQRGLIDLVPAEHAETLRVQYAYTRAMNSVLLLTLRGVCSKLHAIDIVPVVCKGVVLAAHHYPDPGLRRMGDIDIWVHATQREACEATLVQLGFHRLPEKSLPDGENYKNAAGIVIDVHSRMRLFESTNGGFYALSVPAPGGAYRVFDPHAFITHLCVHMADHFPETGPMLCWLLDLGVVLQGSQQEIDLIRLRRLMPAERYWTILLRAIRFLETELGFQLPGQFRAAAEGLAPLPLRRILRQRRLALWGLPHPTGWARLAACALQLRSPEGRPWPSLSDLSLWLTDGADDPWLSRQPPTPEEGCL